VPLLRTCVSISLLLNFYRCDLPHVNDDTVWSRVTDLQIFVTPSDSWIVLWTFAFRNSGLSGANEYRMPLCPCVRQLRERALSRKFPFVSIGANLGRVLLPIVL
jgi:hypothetical protein